MPNTAHANTAHAGPATGGATPLASASADTAITPIARIVAIGGHPSLTSYGEALLQAYVAGAEGAGASVRVHRVATMQFDPILHHGYGKIQPLEPDLVALQRDITWAQHVVVVTPLWWGGVPAALKGLFDRAFLLGWAFSVPDKGLPRRLLKGRSSRVVLSMDSPRWWYWSMYRGSAHGSLVQATLKFVGLGPVRTQVLYGVGHATHKKRISWLADVRRAGGQDAQRLGRRAQVAVR